MIVGGSTNISQHLRDTARELVAIAERIEQLDKVVAAARSLGEITGGSPALPAGANGVGAVSPVRHANLSPDHVREVVRGRNMRIGAFADYLGISREAARDMIGNESFGLITDIRGWIKVREG